MIDKLHSEPLVTPEEAVAFADYRGISDVLICETIFHEYNNTAEDKVSLKDYWKTMYFLATVWNAGRVQGIREERKKRRK